MKKVLGVAFAAGLAFAPVYAFAADMATGVVQSVDIVTGVFVVKADSAETRNLGFVVGPKLDFDNLSLEKSERVTVEYDSKQCAGQANDCVSEATKVSRNKN